ncbi:hypothetical protein [Priestia taiwanensis]|uniref:Uncharacterized protein n=1 Tax=Priestia taiwanensis TaxID=1347902 RepID=A0A917EMG7_9BACI|nr:hypothetical protein [Priestia taiwanensis]MBM7362237.1 hypothetical protein [Priestia taiwanensis]GGE60537.1 hypothetical protein GCM10007140_08580 [Priestia taiwanensis]
MAKIRVYQAKEEHLETVKDLIEVKEQNPSSSDLNNYYTCVFEMNEVSLFDAGIDEDILLDSVESMVNASQQKLRPLSAYDLINVQNANEKMQILILQDSEYEIIAE